MWQGLAGLQEHASCPTLTFPKIICCLFIGDFQDWRSPSRRDFTVRILFTLIRYSLLLVRSVGSVSDYI